jgi:hypothetical protein
MEHVRRSATDLRQLYRDEWLRGSKRWFRRATGQWRSLYPAEWSEAAGGRFVPPKQPAMRRRRRSRDRPDDRTSPGLGHAYTRRDRDHVEALAAPADRRPRSGRCATRWSIHVRTGKCLIATALPPYGRQGRRAKQCQGRRIGFQLYRRRATGALRDATAGLCVRR